MRAALVLATIVLAGCNLIFDLEDAQDRVGGGGAGNGPGGEAPSGGGGSGPTGGSIDPVGGAGGDGGGSCPADVGAGDGEELLTNGSFETGTSPWVESGIDPIQLSDHSDCGCQAALVSSPGGYSELRNLFGPTQAGTAWVRARARATDDVDLQLELRVDDAVIGPARVFGTDAADGKLDGWRTAEGDWAMVAGDEGLLAVVVDGQNSPLGSPVVLDCVSLVRED